MSVRFIPPTIRHTFKIIMLSINTNFANVARCSSQKQIPFFSFHPQKHMLSGLDSVDEHNGNRMITLCYLLTE